MLRIIYYDGPVSNPLKMVKFVTSTSFPIHKIYYFLGHMNVKQKREKKFIVSILKSLHCFVIISVISIT